MKTTFTDKMKFYKDQWEAQSNDLDGILLRSTKNYASFVTMKDKKQIDSWYHFFSVPVIEYFQEVHKLDFHNYIGPSGLRSIVHLEFKGGAHFGMVPQYADIYGWGVLDTTVNSKEYEPGTIGARNGMNYPLIKPSELREKHEEGKPLDEAIFALMDAHLEWESFAQTPDQKYIDDKYYNTMIFHEVGVHRVCYNSKFIDSDLKKDWISYNKNGVLVVDAVAQDQWMSFFTKEKKQKVGLANQLENQEA